MTVGIALLLFTIAAYWLRPRSLRFLQHYGLERDNFAGQRIPSMSGIYIWLLTVLYGVLWIILERMLGPQTESRLLTSLLFPLLWYQSIIFVIGWLDDTIGTTAVKGFKGHLGAVFKEKQFTTGILKAGGTGIVALTVVLQWNLPFQQGVLAFLLMAFMTNTINLLDVRPGRAMKGYGFLMFAALMFAAEPVLPFLLMFPVIISVLMLFPLDVRGKAMLGDTGSNLLGFSAGYTAAFTAPLWVQIGLLVGCVYLHWIAERSSISKLIENNALLRWLDRIGRVHG